MAVIDKKICGDGRGPQDRPVRIHSVFSGCKAVFSPSTTHFHKFRCRIVGVPKFQFVSLGPVLCNEEIIVLRG